MEPVRLGRVAATLLLAVAMVLGVGLSAVASAASPHTSPSLRATAGTAAKSVTPNAKLITSVLHAGKKISKGTSGNWAGYVNTVGSSAYGSIQEVSAEWYTPTITCAHAPSGGSYEVMWVGMDGWGTGTVEQVGTLSYCSTTGATPGYWDWWEFYPYNDIQFVNAISANDFVQAYVLYNAGVCSGSVCGSWTLDLYDWQAAVSIDVTGAAWVCNSASVCEGGSDASAECISEAPSGFGYSGTTPVANYGTLTFYECTDAIGSGFHGIGNWPSSSGVSTTEINQIGASSAVDQQTGSLANYYYAKSEFSITWKHYR